MVNRIGDDDRNPDFLFQGVVAELLVKALNGQIDLQELARQELANRHVDESGNWVGFKRVC